MIWPLVPLVPVLCLFLVVFVTSARARKRRPDYAEIARLERELGFAPELPKPELNLTQIVSSPYRGPVILPGAMPLTALADAVALKPGGVIRVGDHTDVRLIDACPEESVPYFQAWSATAPVSAWYGPPPKRPLIYGPDGKRALNR